MINDEYEQEMNEIPEMLGGGEEMKVLIYSAQFKVSFPVSIYRQPKH